MRFFSFLEEGGGGGVGGVGGAKPSRSSGFGEQLGLLDLQGCSFFVLSYFRKLIGVDEISFGVLILNPCSCVGRNPLNWEDSVESTPRMRIHSHGYKEELHLIVWMWFFGGDFRRFGLVLRFFYLSCS